MKKGLSKKEAEKKIENFFKNENLDAEQVKKIKKLAMKHHILLGNYRKRFCKKCFSDLRRGSMRIKGMYKSVECLKCREKNRWKMTNR